MPCGKLIILKHQCKVVYLCDLFLVRIGGVTILQKGKSDLISDGETGMEIFDFVIIYIVYGSTFSSLLKVDEPIFRNFLLE